MTANRTRSVHFPPSDAAEPRVNGRPRLPKRPPVGAKPRVHDPLEQLAGLTRAVDVLSITLKGFTRSSNRHGDLQVMRSAAKGALMALDTLIAGEEDL